jgi:predicted DNA-binding transcriptional regulator YafY
MKQSLRLQDLMLYLNDKKSFNLKEIMNRYAISKSTALRDVQALEEMGMPIYSTAGRYGCYNLLPNRLLSPIIFTIDEVHALYFAMQTLNGYQSTPFSLNIQRLKEKFEGCISEERKKKLQKMEMIFSLGRYQNQNECSWLETILEMAIDENGCEVHYFKGDALRSYHVQFFDITSAHGQWYAAAYNFESNKPQVFRCDKLRSVKPCNLYLAKPLSELLNTSQAMFRDKEAITFQAELSNRGVDLFYKEHYPSMELLQQQGRYFIKGFYNKGEERFIANYLMSYGETISSIQPDSLKTLILKQLNSVTKHFKSL